MRLYSCIEPGVENLAGKSWEKFSHLDFDRYNPKQTVGILSIRLIEQHDPHLLVYNDVIFLEAVI